MLKKKIFIVPSILVTMNATFVFGRDVAIIPAQEEVSGHAVIIGHAIINDHATAEGTIPARGTSEVMEVIPAEYQETTTINNSDTPESNSIVTTPPVF